MFPRFHCNMQRVSSFFLQKTSLTTTHPPPLQRSPWQGLSDEEIWVSSANFLKTFPPGLKTKAGVSENMPFPIVSWLFPNPYTTLEIEISLSLIFLKIWLSNKISRLLSLSAINLIMNAWFMWVLLGRKFVKEKIELAAACCWPREDCVVEICTNPTYNCAFHHRKHQRHH